jgi:hypothetical protein
MNTLNVVRAVITFILIVSSAYASVLPTGQINCYDASGNIINCENTGQDGEFENEIELNRFIDNGDGSMTDRVTGLTWISDSRYSPYGLNWRVPTIEELKTLFNYGTNTVEDYLLSEGFECLITSYSNTSQPEWSGNYYMMSISSFYGGNSIGTWHNTTTNGNLLDAEGSIMYVKGNQIEVKQPVFTEIEDGVYKEQNAGITWHITNQRMKWEDALEYAKEVGLRLPNINELLSIYDFTDTPHIKLGKEHYYWSATSYHEDPSEAWVIDFKKNKTYLSKPMKKSKRYYVLLVDDTMDEPVCTPTEEKIDESDNYTGSFVVTDPEKEVKVADILKDAGYNHELYAVIEGYEIFLFESGSDEIVNLGLFPAGTVINFKLAVLTTGYDYYTGIADNNLDGVDHCTIHGENNIWTFGFEDMYGGGDFDYNDCVFMVEGVHPVNGTEVEVQ